MHDPFHQFLIQHIVHINIAGVDISFTNSSLFMVIATLSIMAFQYFAFKDGGSVVPTRLQSILELAYDFVAGLIKDNAGREGLVYFPFVLSLFFFVLLGNVLGMLPYGFTYTSHIVVNFALALSVFILVTVIGLVKHKLKFFRLFFPEGTPIAIAPILIPIEIISYMIRPITLSVRLFANMLAGHVVLKIIAGFAVTLGIFGIGPIAVNIALTGFEFFVAAIQAYVFTVLTCLYLHDALHLH